MIEHAILDACAVPEDTYDLVIDSYVSCHLLHEHERVHYLESLLTRVRPGGYLYTACMGKGDTYYRKHHVAETDPLVTDPLNGITKRLQSRTTFFASAQSLASGAVTVTERFVDVVDGAPYDREVVAALLRRS